MPSPAFQFDADLVRKYTRPGPRYTSYPPAPWFRSEFDDEAYRAEIARANPPGTTRPLSLYVHLPFCKSVCRFCGCNVTFTKDRSRGDVYADFVLREMREVAGLLADGRKVEQAHWGGGTPTFLEPSVLARLASGMREIFPFADDAEVGIEIDPRETDDDRLRVIAEHGFRRISVGVQDFDPRVQEAVHRIQPFELTRGVIDRCRELGAESVNVDLMYGLPHQSPETVNRTLDLVVELAPDRVALFNFAYLPDMIRHQRAIDPAALPSPDERLAILRLAIERLTTEGWVFIGMDHFARPEDELARALESGSLYRNFQGYTTRSGCDLHAFGATGIGQFGRVYAQNLKGVDEYQRAVDERGLATTRGLVLSDDDALRRDVITRLLCRFEVDKGEVEAEHGVDFDRTFAAALEELAPMAADGLVALEARRIRVLPIGRLLVRNLAMAFDAYRERGESPRYSSTV